MTFSSRAGPPPESFRPNKTSPAKVRATVTALNPETGTVTVQLASGRLLELPLPSEQFSELSKGVPVLLFENTDGFQLFQRSVESSEDAVKLPEIRLDKLEKLLTQLLGRIPQGESQREAQALEKNIQQRQSGALSELTDFVSRMSHHKDAKVRETATKILLLLSDRIDIFSYSPLGTGEGSKISKAFDELQKSFSSSGKEVRTNLERVDDILAKQGNIPKKQGNILLESLRDLSTRLPPDLRENSQNLIRQLQAQLLFEVPPEKLTAETISRGSYQLAKIAESTPSSLRLDISGSLLNLPAQTNLQTGDEIPVRLVGSPEGKEGILLLEQGMDLSRDFRRAAVREGIPLTEAFLSSYDFVSTYENLSPPPSIVLDFSDAVLQSSFQSESIPSPDKKDFLLRLLSAMGTSLFDLVESKKSNHLPQPENTPPMPKELQEALQKHFLQLARPLTLPDLLQVAEDLRKRQPPAESPPLKQELSEWLQQTRLQLFSKDSSSSPNQNQNIYWFQQDRLQSGKLSVKDERKQVGSGEEGSVRFVLESDVPALGAIQVEFVAKAGTVSITLRDDTGKYEKELRLEEAQLGRELRAAGWELDSLRYEKMLKFEPSRKTTNSGLSELDLLA